MTRARLMINQRGFTLTELPVAAAIIAVVMAGVLVLQQQGQRAYLLGSSRVETQQNARVVLDMMTRELRSAASVTALTNCDGSSGPDITFTDQSSPAKTIRYALSGTTLNRTEDGTTTALVGGIAALTMTCTPNAAATVRAITISIVTTTTTQSVADGDQRAAMRSTVTLRMTVS